MTGLRRTGYYLLLLSACAVPIGCGGGGAGDRPDIGTVEGTVTLDRQPLPKVVVQFYPESGRPSAGTTDESGHYELYYTGDVPGAVVGQHVVRISTPADESDPLGMHSQETIPAKYNSETTLERVVQAGENTFNFELTSE